MNQPSDRPHALELEQWLLSEQDAEQRAQTEARLEDDQLRALRAEDAALRARLLAAHPPAVLAARVRERARRRERAPVPERARPGSRAPMFVLAGLAALGALLIVLPQRELPTERSKGVQGVELHVYRRRGEGVERLSDGAEVAAGELLQLGYLRRGHAHGVLLAIDGRGGVTLLWPLQRTDSTALPAGSGEQLLGQAYELDDAPLFERFIFVGADQPLEPEAVLAAARALATDLARARSEALPIAPASQQSLLLRKRPAR